MKNILNNKKGISYVEIVIAMSIVTIGMVGIVSLSIFTIKAGNVSSGYLTASMLAQEGIELVRGIRDENWRQLPADQWYIDICNDADHDFVIDYRGRSSVDLAATPVLNIDNANKFYSRLAGTASPYSRVITVTPNANCNVATELVVSSEVTWQSSVGANKYRVETILYNWR